MTTKRYSPGDVFFTSDTHFGHVNILKYCSRPFRDTQEMDETMVRLWNEVVPEDGVVFHLGDFAFLGAIKYRELLSTRLHGRKILILGNHDHRTLKKDVWSEIYPQLLVRIGDQKVYLNHFPFLSWSGDEGRIWQLHGHLHSSPDHIHIRPYQLDIGVDGHDFRPWTWEEVVTKIKEGI